MSNKHVEELYKEEEECARNEDVREKIQRTMRLCSHDDDDDEYDEREGILIGGLFFRITKVGNTKCFGV